MHNAEIEERIAIAKALVAANYVITGNEISEIALDVMVEDLAPYGAEHVLRALTRCRRECRGRMSLVDVLDRIESSDGRPTADEAWMAALTSDDENNTVVWTQETAEAAGIARPSLEAGDKVGARMAFKAAYDRLVLAARESLQPVKWSASLGFDVEQRRQVIESAVRLGRIGTDQAVHLLPSPVVDKTVIDAVLRLAPVKGEVVRTEEEERELMRKRFDELRAVLAAQQKAFLQVESSNDVG